MSFTVVCKTDDHAAWLKERRNGIGSSDAPIVVLGQRFGRSRLDLFMEKIGTVEPDDLSAIERIKWGNLLEPVIAEWFRDEVLDGAPIAAPGGMMASQDHPYIRATVDFFAYPHRKPAAVLECKTAGTLAQWEDGPPKAYWIQVQHQLYVCDLPKAYIAVVAGGFGGMNPMWCEVERDQEFIDETLLPACEAFWHCVKSQTPPAPEDSDADKKALGKLYPEPDPESAIELDGEFIDLDARLVQLKERQKSDKTEQTGIENRIKAVMGENEIALLGNGAQYTWKKTIRNDKAREARTVEFRVLRRKAPK